MMTPLNFQALTAILLIVLLSAVSALVPSLSIRQIQSVRNKNVRKIASGAIRKASTKLSLGVDPTDIAQHAHLLDLHHTTTDPTSILDQLSSFTLAKASSVVPNQSLAPLADTIQSTSEGNMVEVIPDMTAMPGGAPRSGNAFLAESFRELYQGTLKPAPPAAWDRMSADGSALVVPAREWDIVARYADLLSRIPLAAGVYALVDFFLINAEEDMAIMELLDEDEEVQALMEVENKVFVQRIVGLLMVVVATISWSYLTYHPVPFSEL